jgi:hypothetical protein
MKIESIRVHPIRSPRKEVARSVVPAGIAASEFGIVCIDCEGGYTGLAKISMTYSQIGSHCLCGPNSDCPGVNRP